jgi:hypothetical protein
MWATDTWRRRFLQNRACEKREEGWRGASGRADYLQGSAKGRPPSSSIELDIAWEERQSENNRDYDDLNSHR